MKKKGPTVLCFRITVCKPVIHGVVQRPCNHCGEPVWVAPSTFDIFRQHGEGRLLCHVCLPEVMDLDNIRWTPPTPEQLAEMPPEARETLLLLMTRIDRHRRRMH